MQLMRFAPLSSRGLMAVLLAVSAVAWLGGCASGAATRNAAARYDLGSPVLPSDSASNSALATTAATTADAPLLKVLDAGAAAGLESDQIRYRLLYAEPTEAHAYANSRWSATPPQLFTQRLRQRLGQQIKVLGGGDPVPAPLLKLELEEFAQCFDRPGVSRGVVAVRVTLIDAGKVLAQRDIVVSRPAATADASGGVQALAAASDAAVDTISAWLAVQLPRASAHAAAAP